MKLRLSFVVYRRKEVPCSDAAGAYREQELQAEKTEKEIEGTGYKNREGGH